MGDNSQSYQRRNKVIVGPADQLLVELNLLSKYPIVKFTP